MEKGNRNKRGSIDGTVKGVSPNAKRVVLSEPERLNCSNEAISLADRLEYSYEDEQQNTSDHEILVVDAAKCNDDRIDLSEDVGTKFKEKQLFFEDKCNAAELTTKFSNHLVDISTFISSDVGGGGDCLFLCVFYMITVVF